MFTVFIYLYTVGQKISFTIFTFFISFQSTRSFHQKNFFYVSILTKSKIVYTKKVVYRKINRSNHKIKCDSIEVMWAKLVLSLFCSRKHETTLNIIIIHELNWLNFCYCYQIDVFFVWNLPIHSFLLLTVPITRKLVKWNDVCQMNLPRKIGNGWLLQSRTLVKDIFRKEFWSDSKKN